jgi:hypothetical protein
MLKRTATPMSGSLLSADRNTHIRIVAVALVAAIVVVTVGIFARSTDPGTMTAGVVERDRLAVKTGQPATVTDNARSSVR